MSDRDSTGRPLSATEAKRLHREWRRRTERPLALLFDNVQTPFNVGAIVRTAASFRVGHIYIAGTAAVTPDHPKSKKTSLGTERYLTWSVHETFAEAATAARGKGLRLVGVELAAGARPLAEIDWPVAGVCLVLGHEDRGLTAAAIALCDEVAFIPTPGKVGSLNVATAAAIAVYEARRAEWAAAPDGFS